MKTAAAKKEEHVSSALGRKIDKCAKAVRLDYKKFRLVYFMAIPMIVFYLLFFYQPMYGAIIAFKNFIPKLGILGSPWVGLKQFKDFFADPFFERVIKNTLILSFQQLIFGFPAPIILALMINEVRSSVFRRTVQTVTYLPHFISLMVICGLIMIFTNRNGLINDILALLGMEKSTMLLNPKFFRPIYVISGIWQDVGWGSIVFYAAIMGVDEQLYEAARIDGVGRLKQIWHVTIPGIMPTIVIMFLMRVGMFMELGYEKVILLYNPTTYSTGDIIASYVYRKGIQEFNFSYAAAVGLFNSVINFILVTSANVMSRRLNGNSLW